MMETEDAKMLRAIAVMRSWLLAWKPADPLCADVRDHALLVSHLADQAWEKTQNPVGSITNP